MPLSFHRDEHYEHRAHGDGVGGGQMYRLGCGAGGSLKIPLAPSSTMLCQSRGTKYYPVQSFLRHRMEISVEVRVMPKHIIGTCSSKNWLICTAKKGHEVLPTSRVVKPGNTCVRHATCYCAGN